MANKLHSALSGADLHECKGAATAASGQVPIASGSGTAVFGVLSYNQLGNQPLAAPLFNGATSSTPVKTQTYTVVSVGGKWEVALAGFSAVWNVQATGVGGVTSIGVISTTSVSGDVFVISEGGVSKGTTETVHVTVLGV